MVSTVAAVDQISPTRDVLNLNSRKFPSLEESYGNKGEDSANPKGISVLKENASSSQTDGNEGKGPNPNPNLKDWRSLFPKPGLINKQATLRFTSPVEINGKLVVAAQSDQFTEEVKKCENRVVGFFVGKRLSFSAVQLAVGKLWKFNKEVRIKLHDNCAFIFDFDDEEDRKTVLDTGSFYIANHLFSLRPWSLLLEKTVAKVSSVPIWVLIYGIPLHMWDNEGLGMISSYLGKPLMADNCTIKQERLAYARICVEIDTKFSYPEKIPVLIDGKFAMDLPVEYPWKPPSCENCLAFGHTVKNCARRTKRKWTPKTPNLELSAGSNGGKPQDSSEPGVSPVNTESILDSRQDRTREAGKNVEGDELVRIAMVEDATVIDMNIVTVEADIEDANVLDMNIATVEADLVEAEIAKTAAGKVSEKSPLSVSPLTKKGEAFSDDKSFSEMGCKGAVGLFRAEIGVAKFQDAGVTVMGGAGGNNRMLALGHKEKGAKNSQVVREENQQTFDSSRLISPSNDSSFEGDRIGGPSTGDMSLLADKEGEWTKVKSKAPLPKKNPFIMKSDFPYLSKSRFPVDSKKQTQPQIVSPNKEEAKLKKMDKEMARLQWEGSPTPARGGELGRGCRSQKK